MALNAKHRLLSTGMSVTDVWINFAKETLREGATSKALELLLEETPGMSLIKLIGKPVLESLNVSVSGMSRMKVINAFEHASKSERSKQVESIIENLSKVLSPKSKTYAECPAIIFLDDAHWIGSDLGLPEFVSQLMHRAKTESWPLMFIATHWPHEFYLQQEITPSYASIIANAQEHKVEEAYGLTTGYLSAEDHVQIELEPVADLRSVLHEHFPGLTNTQLKAILDRSGGNPRFLHQIILYLSENEGLFVDHDISKPLDDGSLEELLRDVRDVEKIIGTRLAGLPEPIQEALCIAARIGVRFSNSTFDRFFQLHLSRRPEDELDQAERPYCFVQTDSSGIETEFVEPVARAAAEKRRRNVRSVSNDEDLLNSLKAALKAELPLMKKLVKETKDGPKRPPANATREEVLGARRQFAAYKERSLTEVAAFNLLCCNTFQAVEGEVEYLLGALLTRFNLTGSKEAATKVGNLIATFPNIRPKEVLDGEERVYPHLLASGGFHSEALEVWEEEQRAHEALVELWDGVGSDATPQEELFEELERLKDMAASALTIGEKERALQFLERRISIAGEIECGGYFETNEQISAILEFVEEATNQQKHQDATNAMLVALAQIENLSFYLRNFSLIRIGGLYQKAFSTFVHSNDVEYARQAVVIFANIALFFVRESGEYIQPPNTYVVLEKMESDAREAGWNEIAGLARSEAERIKNSLYAMSTVSDKTEVSLSTKEVSER